MKHNFATRDFLSMIYFHFWSRLRDTGSLVTGVWRAATALAWAVTHSNRLSSPGIVSVELVSAYSNGFQPGTFARMCRRTFFLGRVHSWLPGHLTSWHPFSATLLENSSASSSLEATIIQGIIQVKPFVKPSMLMAASQSGVARCICEIKVLAGIIYSVCYLK